MNKYKIISAAVICNLLWGSAYPGIKIGYELFNITDSVPQKLFFAGLRFVIAGIIVLLVSIPVNKQLPKLRRDNIGIISFTALVYTALQYVFFYIGLSNTSGSNGSIVNSTTTFMALLVSRFVYKKKVGITKLAGAVIGFLGVLTVLLSSAAGGFSFNGEGFILIAAMCFVAGSLISKKACANTDVMTVTGFNLLFGGIILLGGGLLGGGTDISFTLKGFAILMYLALLSSAAFTLWTLLLKKTGIEKISIFNFIIPISGTIFSSVFMHENVFNIHYLVSLALVAAGIVLVNYEKSQKL